MTVLRFFETSGTACLATEVSLQNVTRITDTYVKTNIHILSNLSQFPLSEQRFGGKAVETSKHILCAAIFSPNIMPFMTKWKNMVQQDRPKMLIWRLSFAFWKSKATDTHSECLILYCVRA